MAREVLREGIEIAARTANAQVLTVKAHGGHSLTRDRRGIPMRCSYLSRERGLYWRLLSSGFWTQACAPTLQDQPPARSWGTRTILGSRRHFATFEPRQTAPNQSVASRPREPGSLQPGFFFPQALWIGKSLAQHDPPSGGTESNATSSGGFVVDNAPPQPPSDVCYSSLALRQ